MNPSTGITATLAFLLGCALLGGCSSNKSEVSNTASTKVKWARGLCKAAKKGGPAQLEAALAKGEDVNGRGANRYTPLHEAAIHDNVEAARWLIAKGAALEAVDGDRDTPLHLAADEGAVNVARLLVQSGANVNAFNEDLDTPLHFAADDDYPEIAQILIAGGANVNHRNDDNQTPLEVALEEKHQGVVDVIERSRQMHR